MDVFAALADPVRRSLLRSMTTGPARVVDLASSLPISRPAVSKHLRLLAEAGLVTATEHGRERHYRLNPEALSPVAQLVQDLSAPAGGPRLSTPTLDALDTEVRRTTRERRRAGHARATHSDEHEETA